MASIVARLKNEDGKYHYGASAIPAPHLGPLFAITATGDGALPEGPPSPATAVEHENWLATLKANGFAVSVVPIDEPVEELRR